MIQNKDIVSLYKSSRFFSGETDLDDKLVYIRKSEVTDEKILLVLPCNAGASKGNYFESGRFPYYANNWRKADTWLRNLRKDIYFAAHSSVEFYFPDGNGAFVFEHENQRVCSTDDKGVPYMKEFSYSDKSLFYIPKMVKDLEKGLDRAVNQYKFKKVICIDTPLAYKTSFYKAVNNLNLWDSVTMMDSKVGTLGFFVKMVNLILYKDLPGILWYPKFSYSFNNNTTIPEEYRYDKANLYINLQDHIILKNVKGKHFSHFCPVYKEHENLSLKELTELYKLPYESKIYRI